MKTALQFGAGNIGRGFMGQLFYETGYHTYFVDASKDLIERMALASTYKLKLLDAKSESEKNLMISNFSAFHTSQKNIIIEKFIHVDVVATAVGLQNLHHIAPVIAAGLLNRKKSSGRFLNIFLCENALDAAQQLHNFVLHNVPNNDERNWIEEHIGFVGTTVARMVPQTKNELLEQDPLLVIADSYHKLIVDGKALKDNLPKIQGINAVKSFQAEVEKKLFIYNMGHAALAYLGSRKNYTYVHETLLDPELKDIFLQALSEISTALRKKYPQDLSAENISETIDDILLRYSNPLMLDTIARVGRAPIRKLGKDDRLIGSALLCKEYGIEPNAIAMIAGAACAYDAINDEESTTLQNMIKSKGITECLHEITTLCPLSELNQKISYNYIQWIKK